MLRHRCGHAILNKLRNRSLNAVLRLALLLLALSHSVPAPAAAPDAVARTEIDHLLDYIESFAKAGQPGEPDDEGSGRAGWRTCRTASIKFGARKVPGEGGRDYPLSSELLLL